MAYPTGGTYVDGIGSDQFDDFDFLLLTNPISTIGSLSIVMRVEILVVNYNNRRGRQVDSYTACFG
jgi:hypothetical protein